MCVYMLMLLLITKNCMFYFCTFSSAVYAAQQHESIVRKLIQGPRVRSLFHQFIYLFFPLSRSIFFYLYLSLSYRFSPLVATHVVFANAASAVIKCRPAGLI